MDRRLVQASRLLSLILRHRPQEFGVGLDRHGWTALPPLLDILEARGHPLDEGDLERILAESSKKRFELSEDGSRIRATHGHSVAVELDRAPATPPATLYHGTVGRFVESITQQGLVPRGRRFVHLSEARQMASQVGSRRGQAVILEVRSDRMQLDGFEFYRTTSGVWLVERVPPQYLVFPT